MTFDRDQFGGAVHEFARRSLAIFPLLVLVRIYELFAAKSAHVLPAGLGGIIVRGLAADLIIALRCAVVLALPILVIAVLSPRSARIVHRIALVVIVIAAVMLSRYFSITFVPLGADIFGYSLREIRDTTAASSGLGATMFLPFIVFGVIAWSVAWLADRRPPYAPLTYVGAGLAVVATIAGNLVRPQSRQFSDEAAYFLAANKLDYFASRSLEYFKERLTTPASTLTGYPLLKPAVYQDVLGPYFEKSPTLPNIVVVIVEGLGRDFVGPGAQYGGFTPFIDSLATRSLYWENFLSNTGRTFGVLPSLLGSLPFAQGGFMELGTAMPTHLTLVKLLNANGYATNYFTGTDGHYDSIDAFMERQNVGSFHDESSFGAAFEKEPAGDGGFSWGYGDRDLFAHSFDMVDHASEQPRLDVYLTITTHEPFIPPHTDDYRRRFDERLPTLGVSADKQADYRTYAGVFSSLLYLDDAVSQFMREYSTRPDYGRTLFIITGDHRLIPIPFATKIARYRVPFIVYSPLLKAPHTFSSVSSHMDVTPSLVAYLHENYGLSFPAQQAWLGGGIDTTTAFRNVHTIPFMRTKNALDDYLVGDRFLSADDLFALKPTMGLEPIDDGRTRDSLARGLATFRQLNQYVTTGEHLYPESATDIADRRQIATEDSLFRALKLNGLGLEELYRRARDLAVSGDYESARTVARRMLRIAPTYYDARALIGRSFGWQRRFDEARPVLEDLVRRAPNYLDGHLALVDLTLWSGSADSALAMVTKLEADFPPSAGIFTAKARALESLDRKPEAIVAITAAEKLSPGNPDVEVVRRRLSK